ncbi:MAG: hypothetical protein C4320_02800, partial [Armatimonadota bacterium]
MQRGLLEATPTLFRSRVAAGILLATCAVTGAWAGGPVPAKSVLAPKAMSTHSAPTFMENGGQWNQKARFMGHSGGVAFWIADQGVTLDYSAPAGSASKYAGHAVGMEFAGSKPTLPVGLHQRGHADYITKAKGCHRSGKFDSVISRGIYPGVDF